ncbi:MAG: hypothetical protein RLZZ546_3063 [Bacteroidota bacterium]
MNIDYAIVFSNAATAFLLGLYLNSYFNCKKENPLWHKIFIYFWIVAIPISAICQMVFLEIVMEDFFTLFLFILVVLFLYKFGKKDDKSIKMIYWLLMPFVIIGGILFISQFIFVSFYKLNKDLLE